MVLALLQYARAGHGEGLRSLAFRKGVGIRSAVSLD